MNADNFIDVKLMGQPVTCLVDTGSSRCLMSYKLFQRFPRLLKRLNTDYNTNMIAANSQKLEVLGYINFFITIGSYRYYLNALVCENLLYDLILGSPFLKRYRSRMDLHSQTISFARPRQAVLSASVTIPAASEITCQASVLGPRLYQVTGLIEPNKSLIATGVAAARSLVNRRQRLVPIKLLSYTYKPVTVPRGSVVGRFHTLPPIDPGITQSSSATHSSLDLHTKTVLDNLDFKDSAFSKQEQNQLRDLITEFSDVFPSPHRPIGKCDWIQHKTEVLPDAQLPLSRPYRLSPLMKGELQAHIRKMLQADMIESSDSPVLSPVVLIPKGKDAQGNDKGTRFCCDFRKLNKVIKDCPEPIPTIQETFDHLSPESDSPSGTLVMSTLDLDQGFHQLVLDPASRPVTSFSTALGNFRYKRVPMGLRASPWFFLRTMNLVLNSGSDSSFKYALAYMDDLLIFSGSVSKHLEHLRSVFSKFKAAGLQLSPRKCQFGRDKVSFLGMVLSKTAFLQIQIRSALLMICLHLATLNSCALFLVPLVGSVVTLRDTEL